MIRLPSKVSKMFSAEHLALLMMYEAIYRPFCPTGFKIIRRKYSWYNKFSNQHGDFWTKLHRFIGKQRANIAKFAIPFRLGLVGCSAGMAWALCLWWIFFLQNFPPKIPSIRPKISWEKFEKNQGKKGKNLGSFLWPFFFLWRLPGSLYLEAPGII